jgi:hypothetical protein
MNEVTSLRETYKDDYGKVMKKYYICERCHRKFIKEIDKNDIISTAYLYESEFEYYEI